ncbi:MAG: hypothetical protein QG608_3834 [Actinomycetota bacterium]|nr:hypothetical protein [Actinomycetota bacterium]
MGTSATFTVFFEEPFWVGVLEVHGPPGVRAARHVFGAEPTGPQLSAFAVGRGFEALGWAAARSTPVASSDRAGSGASGAGAGVSPKRAARLAARQARVPGTSTAAQRALQVAREEGRTEGRRVGRAERERRAARRREVAVRKAKDRHRGR